ncbi:M16 family metallopeptidase [Pseudomonas frederiksbergensis]|uniref:M16 family metallopeptidase n=1 Tax=Pseudomonas frederiksbergensis TaxID=104087 RepID=UPI000F4AC0C1|nr:insulinase family protein [Pseudomonas frederiksbergensis]RON45993.1 hypothetical protein BK667_23545 [Pseudomonas frederiksbergensis]
MIEQDKTVHTFTLNNGLKVIFRHHPTSRSMTAVMHYKVGSSYPEKRELASVVAMALYDNKGNPWNDEHPDNWVHVTDLLHDRLQCTLSGHPDKFERALQYYAHELTTAPLFPHEMIQEVYVKQPPRAERPINNYHQHYRYIWDITFPGSNYSADHLHNPCAAMTITEEDIQDFHQRWIAPNNAVLCIDADMSIENVKALVNNYLGDIPARALPRRPVIGVASAPGERRLIKHGPTDFPTVQMNFNLPILTDDTLKLSSALSAIVTLINSLNRDIPQELTWLTEHQNQIRQLTSYPVHASLMNSRAGAALIIKVAVEKQSGHSLNTLEDNIWALIESLKTHLLPSSMIEDSVNSTLMESQTPYGTTWATQAGANAILDRAATISEDDRQLMQSLTPEEVHEAAMTYLVRNRVSVLHLLS